MNERPRETVSERIKNWTTVAAFILAGAWGVYTFLLTEVYAPRAAPVNVTTELQLRPAGEIPDSEGGALVAIELTMSANNPGPRAVYLLPSYWTAYGMQVERADNPQWTTALPGHLDARTNATQGRHFSTSAPRLVASSTAFPDTVLQPDERVSRSMVFYVPRNMFDIVRVRAVVPSAYEEDALDIDFAYDESGLVRTVFELGDDGVRTEIESKNAFDRYGLQWASSERQLALSRSPAE